MQNQKGNVKIVASFIFVVIVILLVIYVLMNRNKELNENEILENTNQVEESINSEINENENNMETNTRVMSNFSPVSKTTKLEKIDLVIGTGDEVKAGATVSVHYTGAVAATGVVFQSSKDFGTEPVTFPLDGVIKGWTDGIPGMKVGGTRRLVIPAEQAYGANPPMGSGIPANADLVFDVELIAVN